MRTFLADRSAHGMAVVLLTSALVVIAACGRGPEASSQGAPGVSSTSSEAPHESGRINAEDIRVKDLPPEAQRTLHLIQAGGPFPYAKDGAVFGNREGLLPQRPRGAYREYTVPTPGARDRGARRIVSGKTGEFYYSDDHYRSFKRIRE